MPPHLHPEGHSEASVLPLLVLLSPCRIVLPWQLSRPMFHVQRIIPQAAAVSGEFSLRELDALSGLSPPAGVCKPPGAINPNASLIFRYRVNSSFSFKSCWCWNTTDT